MTGTKHSGEGSDRDPGASRPMAGVISLGCSKNLVDTEFLMGELTGSGWDLTPFKTKADLLLINTCSFLSASEEESRSAIEEALRWRKRRRGRAVIVAGCIVSRHGGELEEAYPGVDLFLLPGQIPRLSDWLRTPPPRPRNLGRGKVSFLPGPGEERVLTSPFSAYLKVSDGCTNRCSYCLIPTIRGPHRSRPLRSLRLEARSLIEAGVREINLVGQDLTRWGKDLAGRDLAGMVKSLTSLPGDFRLRLLYLHPSRVDGGIVRLLGGGGKVFPYLDMPIQHASTRVLKAMNRGCSRRDLERIYARLRREAPAAALRTTVMVGFPGEGRREFRELLRFLRECPFENLGCFVFDPQEGTPASRLPNPLRPEEARERRHAVMEQQQELSAGLWRERRGSVTEALVLNPTDSTGRTWAGRTAWQAPEVDGHVILSGPARPGDLVRAEITASGTYDLEGTIREKGPVRRRGEPGVP
jgi:ribosomal protein S12 methylthiotransferase